MKDRNPQARPSKNKNIPHPGRRWYDGQWRTPEQVARRQEQQREKMRKRRQNPEYVKVENAQARERMRRLNRRKPVEVIRWKPAADRLLEAVGDDEELMELVMEQMRDDARRSEQGYHSGLGRAFSLDSPVFGEGDAGDWHEVHGDPSHWREPGYQSVESGA